MQKLSEFFDEYFLNGIARLAAMKFIKDKLGNREDSNVDRLRRWVIAKINNKKPPPIHPRQAGCPEIIPGLRASPWWDTSQFPWVAEVEAAYEDIKAELLALRTSGGF